MPMSEFFFDHEPTDEDVELAKTTLETNGREVTGKPKVDEKPYGLRGRWMVTWYHRRDRAEVKGNPFYEGSGPFRVP